MPQLVNSLCVVCEQQITSIIDGRFCDGCGGPVHNWCARAPQPPVPANVCAACGGNPVLTAVVEKKAEAERRELARRGGKTAVESLVAPLVWWRLIRFALAGVFCIALGFCLIFSPIMRDNPNRLTLNDAAPGIGAIVVGVILFGLLVFVWRRSR